MKKYENIHLIRDSEEHMYIQLYEAIKNMIENDTLAPHEKLPPIRKLSEFLNINNVTVVKAYDLLEKENYVYKRIGSGTFVSPKEDNNLNGDKIKDAEEEIYEDLRLIDRGQIQIRSDMINFASATPTPELFPVEDFKRVLNEVLDRDKGYAFGYQESKGYYPLRKSIVDYLKYYHIDTTEENIQIISGAQQGIDVITKALLKHGDYIVVESPTYTGAIATFKSRGVKIIEVPILQDGIDLDKLETSIKKFKPRFIYTMPNFQNPTGYSYSLDKKKSLLEMANRYGLIIIEDDYLSDLNFYTNDNVTLKSMDEHENVIYIKSFSKIFMPGLRLGFLVVPLRLNNDILVAKHTSDISTSGLAQRAFDLYLRRDIWKNHISYMKGIYKHRYDIMVDSLRKYMPDDIEFDYPKGGINFWVGLPENFSSNELYSECINNKVVFVPGSVFYPTRRESRFFRISIAAVYPNQIRNGIEIISVSIKKYLQKNYNDMEKKSIYTPIL